MKILIAPDAFKHCLTQVEAVAAIERAVQIVFPKAEITTLPLADGGEGTMRIITDYLQGTYSLPYSGYNALLQPKITQYGILSDHQTAVMEAAETVGIEHIARKDLNVWKTSSYGLGIQLAEVYKAGYCKVLIGLGSTACSDAGKGMQQALQEQNCTLADMEIIVLADVQNPLCGTYGAARVFAPQKGATPEDVELLEEQFEQLAAQYPEAANTLGAGAGGGLGFALKAYYNAKIVNGADYILTLFHLDNLLKDCDLVLTAEGKFDAQTLLGKAPYTIMKRAAKYGVPTLCFAGKVEQQDQLLQAGFAGVYQITPDTTPPELALKKDFATQQLEQAVTQQINKS